MMLSIMPLAVMLASASASLPGHPTNAPAERAQTAQALAQRTASAEPKAGAIAKLRVEEARASRIIPAQAQAGSDETPSRPLRSDETEAPDAPTPSAKDPERAAAATALDRSGASQPVGAVSSTERRAILKAAAEALARVETARGRFVQVDPAGRLTEGTFALKRPGRMRFDYDAPTPILIAADGATVAIRDEELETIDRVPLATTPLSLLLDDDLDFQTEADVTDVRKAGGLIAISMRDSSGEADGELTLIFDAGSYDLVSWRSLDANGETTLVQLKDVKTGVRISPRAFIIEEFDDERDSRR